jgi:hypothetical protein
MAQRVEARLTFIPLTPLSASWCGESHSMSTELSLDLVYCWRGPYSWGCCFLTRWIMQILFTGDLGDITQLLEGHYVWGNLWWLKLSYSWFDLGCMHH